jgi:hypothetical protein
MEVVLLDTTTDIFGEAKLALEFNDAIKVRAAISGVFGADDENPGKYDQDCSTGPCPLAPAVV